MPFDREEFIRVCYRAARIHDLKKLADATAQATKQVIDEQRQADDDDNDEDPGGFIGHARHMEHKASAARYERQLLLQETCRLRTVIAGLADKLERKSAMLEAKDRELKAKDEELQALKRQLDGNRIRD